MQWCNPKLHIKMSYTNSGHTISVVSIAAATPAKQPTTTVKQNSFASRFLLDAYREKDWTTRGDSFLEKCRTGRTLLKYKIKGCMYRARGLRKDLRALLLFDYAMGHLFSTEQRRRRRKKKR